MYCEWNFYTFNLDYADFLYIYFCSAPKEKLIG